MKFATKGTVVPASAGGHKVSNAHINSDHRHIVPFGREIEQEGEQFSPVIINRANLHQCRSPRER